MASVWGTNGGIHLGYGTEETRGTAPPSLREDNLRYVGDRHLVTVGPNGSGKSRRLLLPNLLDLTGWSTVVVDPKGELAFWSGKTRAENGSRIVRLNPFNALGLGSDGFNPIMALDRNSSTFPDDAMRLAEAIIRADGRDPHWAHSAQDLLCALIMFARLEIPKATLADVREILGLRSVELRPLITGENEDGEFVTPKFRGQDINSMFEAARINDCPEITRKIARFDDLKSDNREMLSIISTALTQTRWIDSREITGDLSKPTFDFSILKREPTTVYLILPANRLASHSGWLRLMITAILQPLMQDTRQAKVPVLLMLDEFAQLGRLPIIEETMAMMRGYGLKLWTVFQDLNQAKGIYGANWETFLSNAGVLQSFAPRDVFTSDYLAGLTGQRTFAPLAAADVSKSQPNLSMQQQGMPLMLAQDLRGMDDGYSIIFSDKLRDTAALAYMPDATQLERFRGLYLDTPPS